ncbi:hypothetical protein [Methylobacterium sp. OT2]|uniref:hypothetical protein n=1 Tax=Methylobacterium sp. OT2 TaxID=2813779 RepID=UPI00197BBA69|nr:hypothetical protein [Methylobacterium sp. OT2]MBN4095597.1 hypothetical protein [Methylobacterium sp. OT2]
MTTHTLLRLGAAAMVILMLVLLSGAHLCSVAQDPGSRPLSTGALPCIEFWLNRYQTLIAGSFAALAAIFAYGQLKEVRKQSAANAIVFWSDRQKKLAEMGQLFEKLKEYSRLAMATTPPFSSEPMRYQNLDLFEAAAREFELKVTGFHWGYNRTPRLYISALKIFAHYYGEFNPSQPRSHDPADTNEQAWMRWENVMKGDEFRIVHFSETREAEEIISRLSKSLRP